MRDWSAYVRTRLSLPELTPERESPIVRELATQLEDFYREALARGLSPDDADAHARARCAIGTGWPATCGRQTTATRVHASSGSPIRSSTSRSQHEDSCTCSPTL